MAPLEKAAGVQGPAQEASGYRLHLPRAEEQDGEMMPIETIKAYKTTRVNWARTQGQIVELLERKGIRDIQFTFLSAERANQSKIATEKDTSVLDTRFIIPYSPHGIGVRILVPNISKENRNQMHRLLLWYLKSKFEAIESGLVEVMQEFLPHLVVQDKQGRIRTMYQIIGPQYLKALESGEQGEIKMLPEG